ncbi:kynurenine aminotransferase [Gracilaria domingensis]|nr:kynurenine aminotransferase [Gracilaria domingensis]
MLRFVNVGQGAPGWASPPFVKEALVKAAQADTSCQYSRSAGMPTFVEEIASLYGPKLLHPNLQPRGIDPLKEVLVTVGASQALSLACGAFLQEGDEAILIEPAFDIYTGAVKMAGAEPVYVPLRVKGKHPSSANDFYLDLEELSNAITDKTRMLILNSPHNPTGKVFSLEEQQGILDIIETKAPSCIVLSDEVYEHLVFSGKHVPFASVSESAFERTLSVFSIGKTFSATGMKLGWLVGPQSLMRDPQILQQYTVFCVNHTSQAAAAEMLKVAQGPYKGFSTYYEWLCDMYKGKRDFLTEAIRRAGMEPIVPQGAFYICAKVPDGHPIKEEKGLPDEISKLVAEGALQIDPGTIERADYNMSRHLVSNNRVTTIPISAFFKPEHVGKSDLSRDFIRFAFCHPDEVLSEASRRLS